MARKTDAESEIAAEEVIPFSLTAYQQEKIEQRGLTSGQVVENIESGLPPEFVEELNPLDVARADERNALIAELDKINPGNRKSWKISASNFALLFGENAIRDGKARPGYEYKGLPIVIEDKGPENDAPDGD